MSEKSFFTSLKCFFQKKERLYFLGRILFNGGGIGLYMHKVVSHNLCIYRAFSIKKLDVQSLENYAYY